MLLKCVVHICGLANLKLVEISATLFTVKTMVICLVAGCSKRSGRDKDVSFYRIPKIMKNNHRLEGLSRRRRDGFITGKPAEFFSFFFFFIL